jgi:DNA-binding CsgD family transcriptional regulator
VRDDSAVVEISDIAASTAPLLERAEAVLVTLSRCLPSEGTWLALSDPSSNTYSTVGSIGLDRPVIDYLDSPSVAEEIDLTGYNRDRPPFRVGDLAVPADDLPTWAECLIPAGFQDALGVGLFEPGGPHLGVLSLLFSGREPVSASTRQRLARLSPLIARAVSPMRSLLVTARLVQGASAGVVLLRDGTTYPLAGLADDALLSADSPMVATARSMLGRGQIVRSFLWQAADQSAETGHVRVTVLASSEVPALVAGMLLVTPSADCRGLTARELQVLGLVVDGRSNHQIASRLAISPRTVAAHIEHILHKLPAATRTVAAVVADREGCYVPSAASLQLRS